MHNEHSIDLDSCLFLSPAASGVTTVAQNNFEIEMATKEAGLKVCRCMLQRRSLI